MTLTLGTILDANSNRIINLGDGVDPGDAVNVTQLAASVAGVLDLQGELDASTNPNYPAASTGYCYFISVAGRVGGGAGKEVNIGDLLVAKADNVGGTEGAVGADWFVLEMNLLQATETVPGYARLATQAEIVTGTNDDTIVTPLKLASIPTGYNKFTTVVSADGSGDYTTLAAAIAFVATQTPTADFGWTILVTPGEYELVTGTDLPDYTTLEATSGGYGDSQNGGGIVRTWTDIGNTANYTLSLGTGCVLRGIRFGAWEDNPPIGTYAMVTDNGVAPNPNKMIQDCRFTLGYSSAATVTQILELSGEVIVDNCIFAVENAGGANLQTAVVINHITSNRALFTNNVFRLHSGTYPLSWLEVNGTTGELISKNTVFDPGATVSEVLVNVGGTWVTHEAGYWTATGAGTITQAFLQATETIGGMAEVATLTEVNNAVDDERYITPLKLSTNDRLVFAYTDSTQNIEGIKTFTDQVLISSTTKGFVLPRMTTVNRDAIAAPVAGEIVYNTTTDKINMYNGATWEVVTSA